MIEDTAPTDRLRRCGVAAVCATLSIFFASQAPAATADERTIGDERPGLLSQLGAIAVQWYESIDSAAIRRSLRAAEDALDVSATQQALAEIGDAANSLVGTAGATIGPVADDVVALLTGARAKRAYQLIDAAVRDL